MTGISAFFVAAIFGQLPEISGITAADSLFAPGTEYIFVVDKLDSILLRKVWRKTKWDLKDMANPGKPFKPQAPHTAGGVSLGTRLICAGRRDSVEFIALERDGSGENCTFMAFHGEKLLTWLTFSERLSCPQNLENAVRAMVDSP